MNNYIKIAAYEILEILDGMSQDECQEILDEIHDVIQDDENFNYEYFDVNLFRYKNSGDKNA